MRTQNVCLPLERQILFVSMDVLIIYMYMYTNVYIHAYTHMFSHAKER